MRECLAPHRSLSSPTAEQLQNLVTKVTEVVCVEQRVNRGVEVRQHDAVRDIAFWNDAGLAGDSDAFHDIERQPAENKEQHDDKNIQRRLDFTFYPVIHARL